MTTNLCSPSSLLFIVSFVFFFCSPVQCAGVVYLTCLDGVNALIAIGSRGSGLVALPYTVCDTPTSIIIAADTSLLLTCSRSVRSGGPGTSSVLRVQPASVASASTIDLCKAPSAVAFDGARIVAACGQSGSQAHRRQGERAIVRRGRSTAAAVCSHRSLFVPLFCCVAPLSSSSPSSSCASSFPCADSPTHLVVIDGQVIRPLVKQTVCVNEGVSALAVDPLSSDTYFACTSQTKGVFKVTAGGSTVTSVVSGSNCTSPSYLLFESTGRLLIACSYSSRILALQGGVLTVLVHTASVGCANPTKLVVDASQLLFTCYGGGVFRFGLRDAALSVVATVAQLPWVDSIVIDSSASELLYVAALAELFDANGTEIDFNGGVFAVNGTRIDTLLASDLCYKPIGLSQANSGHLIVSCSGAFPQVAPLSRTGVYSIHPTSGALTVLADSVDLPNINAVAVNADTGFIIALSVDMSIIAISPELRCLQGTSLTSTGCTKCPLGTARNYSAVTSTQIECVACLEGEVAPILGLNECSVCQPSTYAVSSLVQCQQCPLGSYSNSSRALACAPCSAGSFGSVLGLNTSSCSGLCAAGYWCGEGSKRATAVPCGARSVYCPRGSGQPRPVDFGYYTDAPADPLQPDRTHTVQRACPPGSYCDGSGLAKVCAAGTAQPAWAQSDCPPCSAGFFAASNSSSCSRCALGEYSSAASAACTPCAPGLYRSALMIECEPCSVGRYSDSKGAAECALCESGSFSAVNGSSSCAPCARGTASNDTGRVTECGDCRPGEFQSLLGKTACVLCPPQTYTDRWGSPSCSYCTPPGHVNASRQQCTYDTCTINSEYSAAAGGCVTCTLGKASSGGAPCDTCAVNSYTPVAGSSCAPCSQEGMEGLSCLNGLASVREGYWAYLDSVDRADDSTAPPLYRTAKCPDGFCPGSQLQLAPAAVNSSSASPSEAANDTVSFCLYPRLNAPDNLMCGRCEVDHIPWGPNCAECTGVNGGFIILGLLLSFLLVAFLLRSSAGTRTGALTVVFLFFAQTAALIMGPVSKWLDWIQLVNFAPSSVSSCIAPLTPYQQTLFSLFMPLLLLGELLIIAVLHLLLSNHFRRSPVDKSSTTPPLRWLSDFTSNFSFSRYVGGAVSILLFCFTQVTQTAVQFLYCVDAGKESVVFTAPTVDCRSSEYKQTLVAVFFVIALYVIASPFAALYLIYSHRRQQAAAAAAGVHSDHVQAADELFNERWGPLFLMYGQHAFYWQPLLLFRRASFVIVSVLLVEQPGLKFMAFTFLNFLSLLVHLRVQPFAAALANQAESVSYSLLVSISLLLTGYSTPYSAGVQALLFLLSVPPCVLLLSLVVRQRVEAVRETIRARKSKTQPSPDQRQEGRDEDGAAAAAGDEVGGNSAAAAGDDDDEWSQQGPVSPSVGNGNGAPRLSLNPLHDPVSRAEEQQRRATAAGLSTAFSASVDSPAIELEVMQPTSRQQQQPTNGDDERDSAAILPAQGGVDSSSSSDEFGSQAAL